MLELVTTFNLEMSICQSISWQVPPPQDNDYSELISQPVKQLSFPGLQISLTAKASGTPRAVWLIRQLHP